MNPIGLSSDHLPISRDDNLTCSYTKIRTCATLALTIISLSSLSFAGYAFIGIVPVRYTGILLASFTASIFLADELCRPSFYNEAEKIKAFLKSRNKDLLTSDITTEGFEHFAIHNLVNSDFISSIHTCFKADRDDLAEIMLNTFISRPVGEDTNSQLAAILTLCAIWQKAQLVRLIMASNPDLLTHAVDTAVRNAVRLKSDLSYKKLSILLAYGSVNDRQRYLMIAARTGDFELAYLFLKNGEVSEKIKTEALKLLINTLPQPLHPLRQEFYESLFKTTSLHKLLAININFYKFFPETWKSQVSGTYEVYKAIHDKLDVLDASPYELDVNGSNAQQLPPIPLNPERDHLDKLRQMLNITMHSSYY